LGWEGWFAIQPELRRAGGQGMNSPGRRVRDQGAVAIWFSGVRRMSASVRLTNTFEWS
jgi:hypothetical protein